MNFLLSISPEEYGDKIINTKGLSETLLFGGQMLLLGMLTVFAVLAMIWLCLNVFKLVFQKQQQKKSIEVTNEPQIQAPAVEFVSDDEEIVAAIAAAIAMAEAESGNIKFKVVSFRRK